MNDVLDDGYDGTFEKKRPVFLTVLCILTYISCGYAFLMSLWRLATGGDTEQSLNRLKNMPQFQDEVPEKIMKGIQKMAEWQVTADLLALGNVALCLAGALLMWKLRKSGFYLYVVGQILPFVSLFGMYSVVQNVPIFGMAMLIVSIFVALFAIAFIIMYAVNLKHMR